MLCVCVCVLALTFGLFVLAPACVCVRVLRVRAWMSVCQNELCDLSTMAWLNKDKVAAPPLPPLIG